MLLMIQPASLQDAAMRFGFLMAGFAWVVVWNVDWRMFVRAYTRREPPPRWAVIALRGFAALCLLGAGYKLLQGIIHYRGEMNLYWNSLKVAAPVFLVIVSMTYFTDWLARTKKQRAEQQKP